MPKRSSKKDVNESAFAVIKSLHKPKNFTGADYPEKNPAAVALGALGGKKGGPARAKVLTKDQRSSIAKKAAKTRWSKKRT